MIYIENSQKGLCKANVDKFVSVNDLDFSMSADHMIVAVLDKIFENQSDGHAAIMATFIDQKAAFDHQDPFLLSRISINWAFAPHQFQYFLLITKNGR